MDKPSVTIAVVGSVNVDLVATVKNFPLPGETVTNAVIQRCPGGKGANQAMAAHRLGARVYMVACLGDDGTAEEATAALREEGVDLSYCQQLSGVHTGQALIIVAASGENQIVVAPGANAAFAPEHLRLPAADAIIAQLEVPMDTIFKAATAGESFFCLNAAPAKPVPREVLSHVDLLVVNEVEADALSENLAGFTGLLATTYGAEGAVLTRAGKELARARPPRVAVLDTTGAGDAFTAALTVSLVSGMQPQDALQRACQVGALTTTRRGAQTSPQLSELL